MTYLKRTIPLIFLLFSLSVEAQRFKEELSFNATGDQTMSLGRYRIGSAIRIECYVSGGWAEDGGIYHIVSDYAWTPTVTLRSESSISNRLTFHGYVDPTSNYYAFLFATWDNVSPNEGSWNNVQFTIYSEATFDKNNTGSFASASELETVLNIQTITKNVGIGTTTPDGKLDIAAGSDFAIRTSTSNKYVIEVRNSGDANGGWWLSNEANGNFSIHENAGGDRLTIQDGGNVGIGTSSAPNKLTVANGEFGLYGSGLDGSTYQRFVLYSDTQNGLYFDAPKDANDNKLPIEFNWRGGGTTPLRINGDGNVGIGTTTPDEKLTVKGKIHTEEVKVDLSVPGPDYVFEKDYDLKSLEEIESFIKSEKHLPEIPSAKEMEANGVELGTMNMLLLKKIEELTLYTLEQEKKINELEAENYKMNSPRPADTLPVRQAGPLLLNRGEEVEDLRGELEKKVDELTLDNVKLKIELGALLQRIEKLENN